MLTNWTRTLKAYIESLTQKLRDYFANGTPSPTPANELQDLPIIDIIGLLLLVILLALLLPKR